MTDRGEGAMQRAKRVSSLRHQVARSLTLGCRALHERAAGRHPAPYLWNHQRLSGVILYRDFRPILNDLHGAVLDVGCGDGQYRDWMVNTSSYTGIDIVPGKAVDHVISPGEPWPLPDGAFDAVLCTQVLEHATNPDEIVGEIRRVARPGATVIISVPFIYNEHGSPYDFRRLSRHGVRELLEGRLEIEAVRTQGGLGSSVVALVLNWLEAITSRTVARLVIRTVLMPVWFLVCAGLNLAGMAVDRLDHTDAFYGNVLVTARVPRLPGKT